MICQVRTVSAKHNGQPVRYEVFTFCCPGCAELHDGGDGLHMLPINTSQAVIGSPVWTFDGNLDAPTLSPSILTRGTYAGKDYVCHSFIRAGVFEYLNDCTHSMAGTKVPLPELPLWISDEGDE